MISEIVNLSIDGQPQTELVRDIVQLDVDESVDEADVFRVRVALHAGADGSWTLIDDDRMQVWKRITIAAGYPDDTQTLVDGYTTHVELGLGDEPYIELTGMDPSVRMSLEDKQLAWANKKDHEIARELFEAHGLAYVVEDTVVAHDEAVATILQSETDIRFLRRLASRNAFECYVRGTTGYFRSPDLQQPPQKLLAVEFGSETNVARLTVRVDGTAPTTARIRRIDPLAKQVESEALTELSERALGRIPLAELRSGQPPATTLLRREPAASREEMQSRLRRAYADAGRFVEASGEIDGRAYQAVLRCGRLVTIKGAGERYSGLYYVTRVQHSFTLEGYTQQFEARRNSVGLTGDEDFRAATLPVAISLPGPGGGGSGGSGSSVLPPQHSSGSTGGI